jgi:hypothetical protein
MAEGMKQNQTKNTMLFSTVASFGSTPHSFQLHRQTTFAQREERISEKEIQRKKRLAIFPSPAGMSLNKLSLADNNLRESLVSDIPAGERKIPNLFTV